MLVEKQPHQFWAAVNLASYDTNLPVKIALLLQQLPYSYESNQLLSGWICGLLCKMESILGKLGESSPWLGRL